MDWNPGTWVLIREHSARVLSESYPMNTNMTGFRCVFFKSLHPCALDKCSISIWSVELSIISIICMDDGHARKKGYRWLCERGWYMFCLLSRFLGAIKCELGILIFAPNCPACLTSWSSCWALIYLIYVTIITLLTPSSLKLVDDWTDMQTFSL